MTNTPALPTPSAYLEQLKTRKAEDQRELCFICRDSGDGSEAQTPNYVHITFCCKQTVHHSCLKTHIQGISLANNTCPYCRAAICSVPSLSRRQMHEREQESEFDTRFRDDTSFDHDNFMTLKMAVYDMVQEAIRRPIPVIEQNCMSMIEDVMQAYKDVSGNQNYISAGHRESGDEFLDNFVTCQLHNEFLAEGFHHGDLAELNSWIEQTSTALTPAMDEDTLEEDTPGEEIEQGAGQCRDQGGDPA